MATDVADLYPVVGDVPAREVLGSRTHHLIDLCSMNCEDLPENELISCLIRQQSAVDKEQALDVLKEVYRLAPSSEEQDIRWVFYELAKKVVRRSNGFKLPKFKKLEAELLQGGNVTTLLEHNLNVWEREQAAKKAAEKAAERAEGRAEGRAEAMANQHDMLRRLVAKLFDADTAERVAEFTHSIDDPERLAEMGELIVECKTSEELLDRLH